MSETRIKFTYEDYKNLPDSETERYELLEGELIMVPSPTTYHQRICRNLEFPLWDFVRRNDLGEVLHAPCDVVLGQEKVVQPDILYISRERSEIIVKEEVRGAPDLIVEIFSPTTAERDRTYKRTLYARHGVKEYWLVDPEGQTIEVLSLGEAGFNTVGFYREKDVLRSPLLSEIRIELSEVF